MPEQYLYAVARIRCKELTLLNSSVMESLLAAGSHAECLRLLSDHGWSNDGTITPEMLLSAERDKTWEFIGELVKDMSVFDVFLYANDYHNLKAAIKAVNDYSAQVEKRLNEAKTIEELETIMAEVADWFGSDPNVKAITKAASDMDPTPSPNSVYFTWLKDNKFIQDE